MSASRFESQQLRSESPAFSVFDAVDKETGNPVRLLRLTAAGNERESMKQLFRALQKLEREDRSRGSGDEEVRHGGEITDDGLAIDVFAEGDGEPGFAILEKIDPLPLLEVFRILRVKRQRREIQIRLCHCIVVTFKAVLIEKRHHRLRGIRKCPPSHHHTRQCQLKSHHHHQTKITLRSIDVGELWRRHRAEGSQGLQQAPLTAVLSQQFISFFWSP